MNCNLTESQKENRKAQTISGQKKKKKENRVWKTA